MKWLYLFCILIVCTACNKGGSVRHCHPHNGVCITADAENAMFPFDPIKVKITLKAPEIERSFETLIMMNQLNDATCKVQWVNESTAHVILQESDETRTVVEVYYDPLNLRMRILEGEK